MRTGKMEFTRQSRQECGSELPSESLLGRSRSSRALFGRYERMNREGADAIGRVSAYRQFNNCTEDGFCVRKSEYDQRVAIVIEVLTNDS